MSYFDLEKKLLNQKYFGDVEETSFLEDFLSKNSATTELGLKRLISKMDDDDFALSGALSGSLRGGSCRCGDRGAVRRTPRKCKCVLQVQHEAGRLVL